MNTASLPERLEDYVVSGASYLDSGRRVLFGIDSDGCVDKGMRYKHGGPFPRAGIELFSLQPIAEKWRIAWAYVNEVEKRGCPRFQGLAHTVDRVLEMPVVQEAEARDVVTVPRLPYLKTYLEDVAGVKGYGDNVLEETIDELPSGDERDELRLVAEWSQLINAYVGRDCPYIAPFPNAVTAIQLAKTQGVDCMIVSGTPENHLRETWEQHGLTGSIRGVFGRESGKKDTQLCAAMRAAEQQIDRMYDMVIMFGDAPGDDRARQAAAKELGTRVAFMPIRVGYEQQDWAWFTETFLENGSVLDYSPEIEAERIAAFTANLDRPWRPDADVTMLF